MTTKKRTALRRLMIVLLAFMLIVLLVLVASVIRDTYWVYGVYTLLAAMLGFSAALVFDDLFHPGNDNPDEGQGDGKP